MRIKLRSAQSQTVSEFSNDVAKALMVAALLGQIISEDKTIFTNLFNFLATLVASLVFLLIAVRLRRKI